MGKVVKGAESTSTNRPTLLPCLLLQAVPQQVGLQHQVKLLISAMRTVGYVHPGVYSICFIPWVFT
jgi:hypothetical protein